jgi:NAD(P)-dependent dehydrogenase (short-subunit alcohol dehydrogenase family)
MTDRLANKVAAITGGASGFGLATARRFAAEGARVALLDRDPAVSEIAAELAAGGHEVTAVEVDVSDERALSGALVDAHDHHGGLHILVNNAGIIGGGWIDEIGSSEHLQRVLAVNVVGVWNGCRSAIPLMRMGGGGVIVNTASVAALGPTPGAPAYGMAKAAVVHLTRSLAAGHGWDNIRVNAVLPGPSATGIFRDSGFDTGDLERAYLPNLPLGRLGTPDDVANAMVFLASDEASFVTGAVLTVDGGFQPRLVRPDRPAAAGGQSSAVNSNADG